MTPWWSSQRTIDQLRWPARLSQIRRSRSGGNGAVGSWPSQVAHRARGGRSSSGLVTGGSVASTWVSSAWSQGWSTALGALVTPFARTSPVAGRNRVSSLAVPPRMYSCGRSAGLPTGAQVAPGCGIAWYGPASSWHQTGTPAASASRYARSMAPFFLPSSDRPLQRAQRPGGRPIELTIWSPLGRRHDPRAGQRIVGRPPSSPSRDLQRPKPDPIEPPHQVGDRARTPIASRSGCSRERLSPSHRQQRRRPLHPIDSFAARLRDRLQLALLRERQRPQALLLYRCHDPPLLPYSVPLATHVQRNAA